MFVALHVHTGYSVDSESSIGKIARYCADHDIDAIGVTDHNTIGGATKLGDEAPGLQVIIGEEILTRQGEVIGLFLKEPVRPDADLRETCLEIKRQEALVYVPHPFDRFKVRRIRSWHLAEILDWVDIIEIYNAKTSLGRYNSMARRYAQQHHKVGAVGSDSHYIRSIGSALNIMEPFSGPQDFLEKLSRAEFRTGAASLLATWWVRVRKLAGVR